jgi:hypothetical protein
MVGQRDQLVRVADVAGRTRAAMSRMSDRSPETGDRNSHAWRIDHCGTI